MKPAMHVLLLAGLFSVGHDLPAVLAGRRYQVSSRADLTHAPWQNIGLPVLATNSTTPDRDATAAAGKRYYRVQVVL